MQRKCEQTSKPRQIESKRYWIESSENSLKQFQKWLKTFSEYLINSFDFGTKGKAVFHVVGLGRRIFMRRTMCQPVAGLHFDLMKITCMGRV